MNQAGILVFSEGDVLSEQGFSCLRENRGRRKRKSRMVAKTDRGNLEVVGRIHNAVLNLWMQGQDRLLALAASMLELVSEGKRNSEEINLVLQAIKDGRKFHDSKKNVEQQHDGDLRAQLSHWQTFYHEIWGIKKDFTDLKIPDHRSGFNWLIVMLEGLTPEKIVQKMLDYMNVYVWDKQCLEKVTSVRTTDKDYAIFVRDRIEADEELKNFSADDLKVNGTNCITLEERLMLEFFYWWKTKKHLDIKNWTLCAGSRYSDGDVPGVSWDPYYGRVPVYWDYAGHRRESLRGRVAVSA